MRTASAEEPPHRKGSVCPECRASDCSRCHQGQRRQGQFHPSSGPISSAYLILGMHTLCQVLFLSLALCIFSLLVGRGCVLHLRPQYQALSWHKCWKKRQTQTRQPVKPAGVGQKLVRQTARTRGDCPPCDTAFPQCRWLPGAERTEGPPRAHGLPEWEPELSTHHWFETLASFLC